MKTMVMWIKRVCAVLALLGLVMGFYWFLARPYQLRWGAAPEEISRAMPGDELDSSPTFLATRAITIDGTPEQVWPWLAQMGFERAGFYGYDVLEGMGSTRSKESAMTILPELQDIHPGDAVPLSSVSTQVFGAIEPNQYLIWTGQDAGPQPGGFTWALYPVDAQHTRMVSRIRWTHHTISQPDLLALDVFTDLTDHLAVRKILAGVKGRVEGSPEAAWVTNLEFWFFVATFVIFVAGLIVNLVRPLAWRTWLMGLAAGVVWLINWYAPVPTALTALMAAAVVAGLVWAVVKRT